MNGIEAYLPTVIVSTVIDEVATRAKYRANECPCRIHVAIGTVKFQLLPLVRGGGLDVFLNEGRRGRNLA